MRNVLAVARRELLAAFDLPIAYVTIAAFLALSALGGLLGFFDRGAADLRDYFIGLRYIFVLFAPAIAMRLWAEERRQGTFELLFTLPVAPWEAVLGKFLGALGLIAVALALGAVLPATLLPFASFDKGALAAGYLGTLLLAGEQLALGLLVSALTENQIVAFVGGAAASFFLLIAGEPVLLREAEQANVPESLARAREVVVALLERVGTGAHQDALAKGVLDTRDLVYFFGFTAFFLFANTVAVERRRPRGRFEAALAIVLALGATFVAQDLATRRHARADLTLRRSFSIGEGMKNALASLEATLTIRCYLSSDLPAEEEGRRRALVDLLDEVEAAGHGNVRLEVVDPSKDERLAAQAEREGITKITRQARNTERVESRLIYCGLTLLYAGKPPVAIPFALYLPNLEYDLAVMIHRLVQKAPRRIAFVSGKDKSDPRRRVRDELARSYTVEDLDLEKKGADDYGTVVVFPDAQLGDAGLLALDRFVGRGGSLVVLAQPVEADLRTWKARPAPASPLLAQLERYGLHVRPALVLAPSKLVYQLHSPAARGIVQVPYPYFLRIDSRSNEGSPVAGQIAEAVIPFACEVFADANLPVTTLVRSYPGPLVPITAETSVDPYPPASLGALGPQEAHVLAAAVTGEIPTAFPGRAGERKPGGRVVLFGSSWFVRDMWLQQFPANLTLFLDTIDWASQDPELASLRGRLLPAPVDASDRARAIAWGVNLAGLPLLVAFAGIVRFLVRRRSGGRAASRSRGT